MTKTNALTVAREVSRSGGFAHVSEWTAPSGKKHFELGGVPAQFEKVAKLIATFHKGKKF